MGMNHTFESSKRYSKGDQQLPGQRTQKYDSSPCAQFTIANASYGGACRSQLFPFALEKRAKTSHLQSVGYSAESLIEDGLLPESRRCYRISGPQPHGGVPRGFLTLRRLPSHWSTSRPSPIPRTASCPSSPCRGHPPHLRESRG